MIIGFISKRSGFVLRSDHRYMSNRHASMSVWLVARGNKQQWGWCKYRHSIFYIIPILLIFLSFTVSELSLFPVSLLFTSLLFVGSGIFLFSSPHCLRKRSFISLSPFCSQHCTCGESPRICRKESYSSSIPFPWGTI